MKVRYTCDGCRSITVDTHKGSDDDPARVFALRRARKCYGKNAVVRTLRLDSWTRDGSSYTYQAFIGLLRSDRTCVGHDIWLTVFLTRF